MGSLGSNDCSSKNCLLLTADIFYWFFTLCLNFWLILSLRPSLHCFCCILIFNFVISVSVKLKSVFNKTLSEIIILRKCGVNICFNTLHQIILSNINLSILLSGSEWKIWYVILLFHTIKHLSTVNKSF